MAKRTALKQKALDSITANGRTGVSHNRKRDACATTTFERPDVLILLGLAITTFGIHAQVIGCRFITIDDLSYINVVLRLPSGHRDNRQVLIWIDAIRRRRHHHRAALAMS